MLASTRSMPWHPFISKLLTSPSTFGKSYQLKIMLLIVWSVKVSPFSGLHSALDLKGGVLRSGGP